MDKKTNPIRIGILTPLHFYPGIARISFKEVSGLFTVTRKQYNLIAELHRYKMEILITYKLDHRGFPIVLKVEYDSLELIWNRIKKWLKNN